MGETFNKTDRGHGQALSQCCRPQGQMGRLCACYVCLCERECVLVCVVRACVCGGRFKTQQAKCSLPRAGGPSSEARGGGRGDWSYTDIVLQCPPPAALLSLRVPEEPEHKGRRGRDAAGGSKQEWTDGGRAGVGRLRAAWTSVGLSGRAVQAQLLSKRARRSSPLLPGSPAGPRYGSSSSGLLSSGSSCRQKHLRGRQAGELNRPSGTDTGPTGSGPQDMPPRVHGTSRAEGWSQMLPYLAPSGQCLS